MSTSTNKKIGVLVSGGVDSSTTAYLLKEKGFDVTGVFIKIYPPKNIECRVNEDRLDAMRACAHLEIPFIEIDATEQYHKKVIDPFVEEYKKGNTPNPDVLCNQYIKFDYVFDLVKKQGFDLVASGHYAISKNGKLYMANDKKKDQTYFLWSVKSFDNIIFPIGSYSKEEVREIARKARLPASDKRDSTGLCFLGDLSIERFLDEYIPKKDGDVVFKKEVIGTHNGAHLYTLGQRHGFYTKQRGPFFVVSTDVKKNIIYVDENNDSLNKKEFSLVKVNMLGDTSGKLYARSRHGGGLNPVTLKGNKVIFTKPVQIASGQSVVIYSKKQCVMGGIVK